MLLHRSADGTRADPACGGHWCSGPGGSRQTNRTGHRSTATHPGLTRRLCADAACANVRGPAAGRAALRRHCRAGGRLRGDAPRWCRGAPVPRSPAGASTPPTNARQRMGRPVHSPSARSSVRFVVRRDAAHRGLSGRRPRTFERTSIPTAVGRGRSRTRVTNRATMSDRPRAGNASGGTYRPSSSAKTIASRDSGRRSFCCMRRNGGRPPPFPLEAAPRARSMSSVCTEPSIGMRVGGGRGQ